MKKFEVTLYDLKRNDYMTEYIAEETENQAWLLSIMMFETEEIEVIWIKEVVVNEYKINQ